MRFRLEVIHTDGALEDPPPFESQDIPNLDDPGTVLLFNAALSGITQATAEYLSWGRDKEGVIADAPMITSEVYKRLRNTHAAREAEIAEELKSLEKPVEPPQQIRRRRAQIGNSTGLLLEPLRSVHTQPSGLYVVGT